MNYAIETLQCRLEELQKFEAEWGARLDRAWAEAQRQWNDDSARRTRNNLEMDELRAAIAKLEGRTERML